MNKGFEEINKRISEAERLLTKIQSLIRIPRAQTKGVVSIDYTIRYDQKIVNQIVDELTLWQFVTKTVLSKLFGENSPYLKHYTKTIIDSKRGRDYKAELSREVETGIGALKSIIESENALRDISFDKNMMTTTKQPLVFISHSSKDIAFVEALVELLEGMGLNETNLFCSSVPNYWIRLGNNIYKALLELFLKRSLYVIFVQSPNYYNSPVSLNEMGAAWAMKSKYCSILTAEMDYSDMKSVVNDSETAIKVNTDDAKARLTEMKEDILSFLELPAISSIQWERKRDKFLSRVNSTGSVK